MTLTKAKGEKTGFTYKKSSAQRSRIALLHNIVSPKNYIFYEVIKQYFDNKIFPNRYIRSFGSTKLRSFIYLKQIIKDVKSVFIF